MPEASPVPETSASQPVIRPEYVPQKAPQPLARNFEQRIKQLDKISSKPTEEQIAKLGTKFLEEGVGQTGDVREHAQSAFDNMRSLIQDRRDSEEAVKRARSEALVAPRTEFRARVEALREVERRRYEINTNLKSFSEIFQDAGVMVEPSQQDTGLGDKVNQKAYELGWQMAAGASRVGETVKGGVESVKEGGKSLIELGRKGLGVLVDGTVGALKRTQANGQASFDVVRSGAEAGRVQAAGGLSKITEAFRGARERISQKVSGAWEAASVWVGQRREDVAGRVGRIEQGLSERISSARAQASQRIESFYSGMKAVGEGAKSRWDQVSESVRSFATEQAARIDNLRKAASDRIMGEISVAMEKGRIFLEPAWESIQRDREVIKENRNTMQEKLGIIVEGVSDLASPVVDRILDSGRDVRDSALGFMGRHTQGLRVFGRNALDSVGESPAWNFMKERWESLRLRSNEARGRLNQFLNGVLGENLGSRFKMLPEAAAARAKRLAAILPNVKIENGFIIYNGKQVSKEVSEWFIQNGTVAKEFLNRNKERVSHGLDLLQRYWEIYAVSKWREAKLPNLDVQRRMKLLRGIGAASLDRAARVGSMGTAMSVEGAVMLQQLARNPKGRVALGLAAIALGLALSPEIRDGLQDMLSNVNLGSIDLANLQLPDLGGGNLPDVGTGGNFPLDQGPQGPVDIGNIPAPDSTPVSGVTVIPDSTPISGVSVTPDVSSLPGAPSGVETTPPGLEVSPSLETPAGFINIGESLQNINPRQPLEAQVRTIAGGVNETYYNLLQGAFEQFKDNFLTTAQTIVNNPSNYTPEQVSIAQQQLQAAAQMDLDPSLIQGSQQWYDTIMRATHFWRP